MYKLAALGCIALTLAGCGTGNTKPQYQINPNESYLVKDDGVYWSRFVRITQRQVELKVDSIDKATFTVLSDPLYAKDKNYVYYKASPIAQADPASFTVITSNFTKDSHYVYLNGEIIKGADPASFTVLKEGIIDYYSKDKKNHYYSFTAFKPCDEKSFSIADGFLKSWATDSQCAFNKGKKLNGADMSSFKILEAGYAKDKQHVYHMANLIPNADVASFTVNSSTGKDKNNCYKTHITIDCTTKSPKLTDLSAEKVDEMAFKMAMSWVEDDLQKKRSALAAIPDTVRTIATKYQGDLLTPADVKNINLTKLPVGHVYSLTNRVPASITEFYPRADTLSYKVKSVTAGGIELDVIHPKNFGSLTEIRLANGKKTSSPLMTSHPYSREYFLPNNCEFELGSCEYTSKIDINGTPRPHSQTGKYEQGVWTYTVKTQTGKNEITTMIYDKTGLPIYMSRYIDDSLYYEFERTE